MSNASLVGWAHLELMALPLDQAVALAAGASAGIIADVALFPLDLLKTHAQGKTPSGSTAGVAASGSTSPFSCAVPAQRKTVPPCVAGTAATARAEGAAAGTHPITSFKKCNPPAGAVPPSPKRGGLSACYRGIAALAMGSMPSSAGFFVVYEAAKERLKRLDAGRSPVAAHVLSAAIAEMSACVIRNPFEVVKQQVQLGLHESTAAGFQAVWRFGGFQGFFVGMGTSMLRDVPFAALQLSLWEWLKLKLLGENQPSSGFSSFVSAAAGMAAGAVAAVVTAPVDVAKTRLMTQEPGTRQFRGFVDCLASMLRNEGLSAMFLGVKMRCLWVALGGGIFLGGYDAFKAWYSPLFERSGLFQVQPRADRCRCVGGAT